MINDIANIAFEHITGDYHWGKYGDFKVIINIKTRYINATNLCKLAESKNGEPKQFGMWKQNKCANDFIDEVAFACGISQANLFNIITTGYIDVRGTYAHPDLIPHIASWASPKFAVRVSRIVNEQMVREYRESIRVKDDKIDELTRQMQAMMRQNNELMTITRETRDESKRATEQLTTVATELDNVTAELENMTIDNKHLVTEVDAISTRLKVSAEDRVPKHPNVVINEAFAVYHMPGTLKYKTVSRQKKTFSIGVSACITSGFTQRIFYSESPNAVNLRARIRDNLPKDTGKVSASGIDLVEGKTTEDLLIIIRAAEAEKRNV